MDAVMTEQRRGVVSEWLFVLACVSGFFALTLIAYGSPGLIFESVADEMFAVRWIHDIRMGVFPPEMFDFPLYHGHATSYLMMPFVYLFGPSWDFVRLWPKIIGAGTLLLSYVFMKDLFGARIARWTLFLSAIHPSYVLGVKSGNYHVSWMTLFSVGTLLCVNRWAKTKRYVYLCVAFLLIGVGIMTRIWFLWFVAALGVSTLVWGKELGVYPGSGGRRFYVRLAACATLLLGPFLILILKTELLSPSLTHMIDRHVGIQVNHQVESIVNYGKMLSGEIFCRMQLAAHDCSMTNGAYPVVFYGCFLFCVGWAFFRRSEDRGALSWLLLLFASMFLFMINTHKAAAHHIFVFYPLPQMVMAIALGTCQKHFLSKKTARYVFTGVLSAFLFWEASSLAAHLYVLKSMGPSARFTDSLYEISDWLHRECPPGREGEIVMCPGPLEWNLIFLRGSVIGYPDYPMEWPASWPGSAPRLLYLVRTLQYEAEESAFIERACREYKKKRIAKIFVNRDGTPTFEVLKLSM